MYNTAIAVILFTLSLSVSAATCVEGDVTKEKWHFYSDNPAVLYCQASVAGNNKVSGFCRGNNEFDKGTKTEIDSGKLKVSDGCDVTGTIKLSGNELGEFFGGEDLTIKILKARMSDDKDAISGLLSIQQSGLSRHTFSASRD